MRAPDDSTASTQGFSPSINTTVSHTGSQATGKTKVLTLNGFEIDVGSNYSVTIVRLDGNGNPVPGEAQSATFSVDNADLQAVNFSVDKASKDSNYVAPFVEDDDPPAYIPTSVKSAVPPGKAGNSEPEVSDGAEPGFKMVFGEVELDDFAELTIDGRAVEPGHVQAEVVQAEVLRGMSFDSIKLGSSAKMVVKFDHPT